MMVVIPKPNKQSYDSPKSFRLIVLLNILGKLIKKVIGKRFQFLTTSNNFIHPSQLGSLKFKSMTDVGMALTYIIQSGWVKNLLTSILAFDIVQFFLSLNYCLLTLILKKVGFNNHVILFFANYLVDRKTNYFWNSLYGFQLWFYNHAPMLYHLKILGKMQRRAVIWILKAFKTSLLFSIKAIAGLIPIKLHL